jgi:hypothetical protein
MDNADEKNNNDLTVIANHYFKPNVYYINCSNVDWNYEDMPKYIQFYIIDKLIRELNIPDVQKKIIRNITNPNIKQVCKVPFENLNNDVISIIEQFSLDYTLLFTVLRKIWIKQYREKINDFRKENNFDKMWYDYDSNDYHYTSVSLEDLQYLYLKLNNTI